MKTLSLATLALTATFLTGCPANRGMGDNPGAAVLDGVKFLQQTEEALLVQADVPHEAIVIKRTLADFEGFSTSSARESVDQKATDRNFVVSRIYFVDLFGRRKGSDPRTEKTYILTQKVRCSRTEYPSYSAPPSSATPGLWAPSGFSGSHTSSPSPHGHTMGYGPGIAGESFPVGTYCQVLF